MYRPTRVLVTACLLAAAPALRAQPPVIIDSATLLSHRVSGETVIETPTDQLADNAVYRIEVDEAGKVVAAGLSRPVVRSGAPDVTRGYGRSVLQKWSFRPFVIDGRAVRVRSEVTLMSRPADELWSDTPEPFPELSDRDFEVRFVRGRTLTSTGYSVSIRGDGTVRYAGAPRHIRPGPMCCSGSVIEGEHVTRIPESEVDALVVRFRAARFFAARNGYHVRNTERPSDTITFRHGAQEKAVGETLGPSAGMPAAVFALEQAILDTAGSARWISGNADTIPALAAEGFDFHSDEARMILRRLMQYTAGNTATGQTDAVLALLDRGVLAGPAGNAMLPEVITAIARSGNVSLLQRAVRNRWLDRLPDATLTTILIETGGRCSPAAIRILLGAGANPRVVDPTHGSALHTIRRCGSPADAIAVTRLLLERGAPASATSGFGATALFGAHSAEVVAALVAAGARADIRSLHGETALFAATSDAAARALLEAGADPTASHSASRSEVYSFRDHAGRLGWFDTLDWLDAHDVR